MVVSHDHNQDSRDLVDTIFDEKYFVEKLIGQGGTGKVYCARELTGRRRRVAIKILAPDLQANPNCRSRFNLEVKAAQQITHPNLIKVYEQGTTKDGTMYLVMQYVRAPTLRDCMWAPWSPTRVVDKLSPIMNGLQAVHEADMVHRDLKPENILMASTPKLLDFSIVKFIRRPELDREGTTAPLTKAGDVLGTYHYMPPEQWKNANIDCRADIYSLACVYHELIAGQKPFSGTIQELREHHEFTTATPLHELVPSVPRKFSEVIAKAMAKNPDDRPRTMAEFQRQLRRALKNEQPLAHVVIDVQEVDGRKHIRVVITQLEYDQPFSLWQCLRQQAMKSRRAAKLFKPFQDVLNSDDLRGRTRDIEVSLQNDTLRLILYPHPVLSDSTGKPYGPEVIVDPTSASAKCEYWPDANLAGGTRFVIELTYGKPFRLLLVEKNKPSAPILEFVLSYGTGNWPLASPEPRRHLFAD